MNLNLSEEQELFLDATSRFLETESPLAQIREQFDHPQGYSDGWWRQAAEIGWNMLAIPETMGGISLSGNSGQDLAIVAEAMGRGVAPGPFMTSTLSLYALANGTLQEGLSPLLSATLCGENLIAWAFGEPGNIWDTEHFGTSVVRDGDALILDGVKAYVEAGAAANHFVVTAKSEYGLSQILLPADTPGVKVKPCQSIDFVRRFAQIHFDQVRVNVNSLLHETEDAKPAIDRQLQLALILQCAESNGAVERAMDMTMEYMQDRYAFGRAIASYQALKHRLADMALQLHSCMAITDAAIAAFDTAADNANTLAYIAKRFVGTTSTDIMSDLVQMTGGIALTWEHDLHLFSRRVALNRAVYGTPETYSYRLQQVLAA